MWVLTSLESLVQPLSVAFTSPSFKTHCQVLMGWLMCIGRRTEFRVFETIQADTPVARNDHHPFDRFYNFFSVLHGASRIWRAKS